MSARVEPSMPLPDVSMAAAVEAEPLVLRPPAEHVDDALEAVAALAGRQSGIAESTLIDLVARVLQLSGDNRGLEWDIVRAWVEVGFLDLLSGWRWSGRKYFARRPHVTVMTVGGELRAAVSGLLTVSTKKALRSTLPSIRCKVRIARPIRCSVSSWGFFSSSSRMKRV
jgi:hypothetical protein